MDTTVGEREIHTQERVINFFRETLGYLYLGHWQERAENSNIETRILADWLRGRKRDDRVIHKALDKLTKAVAIGGSRTLYEANREVYELLRYGVKVQPEAGEHNVTVWLIDWEHPLNNDFGIAEEVTLESESGKKCPDLVLYINGIAIGVLELKRSTVSVSEGIRQNLTNQRQDFIERFFTTVQLVMAGNESQGLHYGVIKTSEKHWLRWKDTDTDPAAGDSFLLRELSQVCNKTRMLDILHNFIVFDAGIKKICRHNQYFGVKAAQARVKRREGGIIWHTQGSGKSLTMVWLAKSILETIPNATPCSSSQTAPNSTNRLKAFSGVSTKTSNGHRAARISCGSSQILPSDWSVHIVHKFGGSGEIGDEDADVDDYDDYVEDIKRHLPDGFRARGEFFVFVDECHRTQSGKLHSAMKTLLPDAMLIGFTGTPLLKSDKQRSIETFGPYIHTYKYDEAVFGVYLSA